MKTQINHVDPAAYIISARVSFSAPVKRRCLGSLEHWLATIPAA